MLNLRTITPPLPIITICLDCHSGTTFGNQAIPGNSGQEGASLRGARIPLSGAEQHRTGQKMLQEILEDNLTESLAVLGFMSTMRDGYHCSDWL